MTEQQADPCTRLFSRPATRVFGGLVFGIGLVTAVSLLLIFAQVMVHFRLTQLSNWLALAGIAFFAILAIVLLIAGYRMLFLEPGAAGAMLPRFFWRVLSVVLALFAAFGVVVQVGTRQFVGALTWSSVMMATFSWWCLRFARRGAISRNRSSRVDSAMGNDK